MLKKSYPKFVQVASIAIAYLFIPFVCTVILHLVTKTILRNLQSIPIQKRQGYDNPFASVFAVVLGFLFVSLILYEIINALISRLTPSMLIKIMIGIFAGVIPLMCLQLMTFGISIADPGMLTEFIVMALGGGLLPVVQKLTIRFFKATPL